MKLTTIFKKLLRSTFLHFPDIYNFMSNHRYWINYYFQKVHEEDFKAFKLISRSQPQLFLDVGANIGMSALSILTVKPNAKVISFEPNPLNYPFLEKIANKFDSFEYKKFGLADEEKSLNLYWPIYNKKAITTLASFDYEKAKNWLSPKTIYFFEEKKINIENMTAELKTLDSLNLNPDFIKIDVQGFEYQVLLGAEETIKRCKPIFLIESVQPNGNVHNFLKNYDYSVFKFKSGNFFLNQFNSLNQFLVPQEKFDLIQDYLIEI